MLALSCPYVGPYLGLRLPFRVTYLDPMLTLSCRDVGPIGPLCWPDLGLRPPRVVDPSVACPYVGPILPVWWQYVDPIWPLCWLYLASMLALAWPSVAPSCQQIYPKEVKTPSTGHFFRSGEPLEVRDHVKRGLRRQRPLRRLLLLLVR